MRYKELVFDDRATWLHWRHWGIGSSDASIIMGVSRFKNRSELILEKALMFSGEDNSNAYVKDRGNKIETAVRAYLEQEHQKTYSAVNCEMVRFPFMRASIDGASSCRKIISEIKLLSIVNPDKINMNTDGYKKWMAAKIDGIVPIEYIPQIQHQLMVTGAEYCLFVGYMEVKDNFNVTDEKLAIVRVYPDKDYQHQLFVQECLFWFDVETKARELEYKEGELE